MAASRPPQPAGVARRLSHGLLQAKLFGAPSPRLGRFEVRRKLGEGGMGAVFEASDPALDRAVAIKVIRQDSSRGAPTDPAHEARMLARLSHPNVVTVYELGEEDGERYVCMALVDGPNLASWLARNPEAGWRARLALLRGAAAGLAAAHRAGVIHRDFKLENVLVGADGVPRVTDFGLARTDEAPMPPQGAAPGPASTLAGTPGYIAPEVLRGERATEKSDQYAFFVALRRALGAEIPPALARHVERGLSPDPEARFPDMLAAGAALDAAAEPPADHRAREVLAARLRALWIGPARSSALTRLTEAPLGADGLSGADLGGGDAPALARALSGLRAGVVLIGAPGAGKTLRLLAVAEALLQREDGPVPVVLSPGSFSAFRGTFGEWVVHELVGRYALPREQVSAWMAEGQLALLLDGLDEVPGPARQRCVDGLDALRAEKPTAYLITCREESYRALARRPRCDAELRMRTLAPEALPETLRQAGVPEALRHTVLGDPALAEQLRNPLLLAMFVELSAEIDALNADNLRERLYARALTHALDEAPPLADRAAAEAGVRWLAAAMERAGAPEIWLEDIQAGWLPTRAQRALALGLGLGAAYAFSLGANLLAARAALQPTSSGVFFGILAMTAAIFIHGGVRVVPMEQMRWSAERVRAWVPRNLALGVLTGGLHGIFFDLWADLMLGVATGLLGLSVIGLVPAGRERRVKPGDGLLESLRNSLIVSPLVGLIIGVPVGYLVLPLARPLADPGSMYHTHPNPELAWAVTMGTSATVTSLFITGLLAPVLHLGIRVALAATTPLPLALRPWLDGLADRGLLRRVGGGWAFRHATFRAWLAGTLPGTLKGTQPGSGAILGP